MDAIFNDGILILDSTVRLSVVLLLAALAGLFSERSGVFDIGLEGKMLAAAFAAAAVAAITASYWLGLLAGIGASVFLALVHGFASITHRGNQIVSGVAINFLAAGLTALLGHAWFRQGGRTPPLPDGGRFPTLTLPRAEWAAAVEPGVVVEPGKAWLNAHVPILGPFYNEVISGHYLPVYIAFLAVPVTWWILYRTRFGLRLRAVGENPAAVDTAGISVAWLRYRAVICTGILCGIAGAYLSTAQSAGFNRDMTAGQGFIALAALIFAKWRPVPLLFTCLLFGFLAAAQIRLQGVQIPGFGTVPVQAIQALPYILTVVLLAGFIGKAVPPKAGGAPYVKER